MAEAEINPGQAIMASNFKIPTSPLSIWVLQDNKPGHFNQSLGVVAALDKHLHVHTQKINISGGLNGKVSRWFAGQSWLPSALTDRFSGIPNLQSLPTPELIISAGGRTLAANVILAKRFSCLNIFSGSLRGIPPEDFSATLHINPELEGVAGHIIGLKPSTLEPDPSIIRHHPPKRIALLTGGPIRSHPFQISNWEALLQNIKMGQLNWDIVTSRRTPTDWVQMFQLLTTNHPDRINLHDYNKIGPGKVQGILAQCDAAVISDDSASMISEAVAAGIKTVSLTIPSTIRSTDLAYLKILRDQNLYQPLDINSASEATIVELLNQCQPLTGSPLDILCNRLIEAIPVLKKFEFTNAK